jgi:hypothetical protein
MKGTQTLWPTIRSPTLSIRFLIAMAEVEKLAYGDAPSIWQAEGMPEGRDKEHWVAAEREVLMAEASPSLGTRFTAGEDVPNIRSASGAGGPAAQHDGSGDEPFEASDSPMTAGAPCGLASQSIQFGLPCGYISRPIFLPELRIAGFLAHPRRGRDHGWLS